MLVTDLWSAFQQGKQLANSATWKNRAIATNAIATFAGTALAIATAFGYQIDVDSQTVQAIAGGIAAAFCLLNGGVHIVTSDKVGLPQPGGDTGYRDVLGG